MLSPNNPVQVYIHFLTLTVTLTRNAEVVCAAKLTTVARGKVCKENETND